MNRSNPIRPRMTEQEAAVFLGVVPKTLQAWRQQGRGPRFLKIGRAVRYDVDTLDEWLQSQERQSTSDSGDGRGRAA